MRTYVAFQSERRLTGAIVSELCLDLSKTVATAWRVPYT